MPLAFSSGALSIWSKATNCTFGLFFARTFVMAAVKVVLPWSTCPIVPMFTCGLLRSNFSLLIFAPSKWSPDPGLNWRPHPYQGCALPSELSGLVYSSMTATGAGNGTRTHDIQLGRLTLYQLSYSRLRFHS